MHCGAAGVVFCFEQPSIIIMHIIKTQQTRAGINLIFSFNYDFKLVFSNEANSHELFYVNLHNEVVSKVPLCLYNVRCYFNLLIIVIKISKLYNTPLN